MQTYDILLEIIGLEIKATLSFLEKFCNDEYSTAIIKARKITKIWDIDSTFAEIKHKKKKRLFRYEDKDKSNLDSEEMKFNKNFFCFK